MMALLHAQFEKSRSCTNCPTLSSASEEMEGSSVYQDIPELLELSNHRGVKILHVNLYALLPRIDKVWLLLQRYENIDCFAITETLLVGQVSDDDIDVQGYIFYRLD